MKIALVILHANAARGGAERYTLDLAAALVKRGHDVWILASSFQSQPFAGKPLLIEAKGMTRTGRYEGFIDRVQLELGNPPHRFDVVHAMLPIRRCDIYHPHAGVAAEAVAAGHLNKAGGVSRLFSRLGNRFNARRHKFAEVEREMLAAAPPVIFCLSDLIKTVVKKHYPDFPDEKLISLFNGIDLDRFDPSRNQQARKTIRDRLNIGTDAVVGLMLAQDFERKGLRQAIEALARVEDSKLLLIVGGKPDPSVYQKSARSLGVAHRMRFVGSVAQPADFYQAADFFLLPTFFDPCSLVVLEALAMGLPVISTMQNGACEIMIDGVHGRVLTDPGDIAALANSIAEMLDPARRKNMASACLGIRPMLSQDAHVSLVEAIYSSVTESPGGDASGVINCGS